MINSTKEIVSVSYQFFKDAHLGYNFLGGMSIIQRLRETINFINDKVTDEQIVSFFSKMSNMYKYKNIQELTNAFFDSYAIHASIAGFNVGKEYNESVIIKNVEEEYMEKKINIQLIKFINTKLWPIIVEKSVKCKVNLFNYLNEELSICKFSISDSVLKEIYDENIFDAYLNFNIEFSEWCRYNFFDLKKIEMREEKNQYKIFVEL